VVAELARGGVAIGAEQLVGLCPARAASPAADGRLLEGRIAAAASLAGAERCAERGGEEHVALGARLRREADELARLAADQDAVLGGADGTAVLGRGLEAAGVRAVGRGVGEEG